MDAIKFSFDLWDRGVVSIEMPAMNGGVNTSKFTPKEIFTRNATNPFFAQAFMGPCSISDPNEVKEDLHFMIQYINTNIIALDEEASYVNIVNNSVQKHIQKYGRLFFTDLCTYIDIAAHIMSICNYEPSLIRNFYIFAIFNTVKNYGDLVKDGHPIYGIFPFSDSPKFRNVLEIIKELK